MRRISSSALVEVQNVLESYRQEVERSQTAGLSQAGR